MTQVILLCSFPGEVRIIGLFREIHSCFFFFISAPENKNVPIGTTVVAHWVTPLLMIRASHIRVLI